MSKLTKSDEAQLDELLARRREKRRPTPTVSIERQEDGIVNVKVGKNSDELEFAQIIDALGIFDSVMFPGFLTQVGNAVSAHRDVDQERYRFAIGFVKSIEPRDELEAMLAAQMAQFGALLRPLFSAHSVSPFPL